MCLLVLLLADLWTTGCAREEPGKGMEVVAATYPLAWMAERVGGERVGVEDLTPPGVGAHDVTLTAEQRADIETSGVVLYLGNIGFQASVEQAVGDAKGIVLSLTDGLSLASGSGSLAFDPHVWLDPGVMADFAPKVASALAAADSAGGGYYEANAARLKADLEGLDARFSSGLSGCRYREFVVAHEAFGYLARAYGLTQLGLEGLSPESEPSAGRIQVALDAISSGVTAPAVFYDPVEGNAAAQSVAADAGVPAIQLLVLETQPPSGDYMSAMDQDLSSLSGALQCK